MGSILMSVMNYVSSEIKIIAVKHSLVGTESLNQSAARFGVSRSTLQKWLLNYEMFGTEGLCHRTGNHHYSKEIKREAVEAYLSGRMSEEEICKKYQIRSRTQRGRSQEGYMYGQDQRRRKREGGGILHRP